MPVLNVLACVRTPDAARAVAVCADRLGVGASVRTAVTAVEAIARLAERPADLVFVDGPLTRPDPVGFVRRAMAYAPGATLVVYGLPEPAVASALIAAGARTYPRDWAHTTSATADPGFLDRAPASRRSPWTWRRARPPWPASARPA